MTAGGRTWEALAPWERVAEWEKAAPETAKVMIQVLVEERQHARRLAWVNLVRQFVGVVLGFGCVVVVALVAWHYVDLKEPLWGGAIFGTGTVSTVAIFVTGRLPGRRR